MRYRTSLGPTESALSLRRMSQSLLALLWATALVGVPVVAQSATATNTTTQSAPEPPPSTPREFFNAGTRQLRQGKLREAEAFFESALASQNERLQTPAIYNLGHVRFSQGIEELKKGPSAAQAGNQSALAEQHGDAAIRTADEALESNQIDKMVAAYLNGRGKRRELKSARQVVRDALKTFRTTLTRWQRASGDFKGAVELDSSQTDAQFNANVVDRRIAQLVDSLRELEQRLQSMTGMCNKLNQKLKQLKGRIPAPQMPPGAADDDEEDEDAPMGPPQGQKEAPSKEGKEMLLSPEQAGWLLEGFKLDSERRLPMGQFTPGDPKDRSRKPW